MKPVCERVSLHRMLYLIDKYFINECDTFNLHGQQVKCYTMYTINIHNNDYEEKRKNDYTQIAQSVV